MAFDGRSVMILITIILLLAYLIIHFDIIARLRDMSPGSKRQASYIKVLINDAMDYLNANDYEKAALIYREIKLSYENAGMIVKRQIYDQSYDLCNRLDLEYALLVIDRIESCLKRQDRNAALMEFAKLEQTLNKMDELYRSGVAERFQQVLQLLQENT
jgi:hypothetical protein